MEVISSDRTLNIPASGLQMIFISSMVTIPSLVVARLLVFWLVIWLNLTSCSPFLRIDPPYFTVTVTFSPFNMSSTTVLLSSVSSMSILTSTATAAAGAVPTSSGMPPSSPYYQSQRTEQQHPPSSTSLRKARYISQPWLNLAPYTAPFFILWAGFNSSPILATLSNKLTQTSSSSLHTQILLTLSTCTTKNEISLPSARGNCSNLADKLSWTWRKLSREIWPRLTSQ